MRRIIGLCGYARVGKDTAAKHMPGWQRFAFADPIRDMLAPLIREVFGWDIWRLTDEQKKIIRPLMVDLGRGCREVDPGYWVKTLWPRLPNTGQVVITDVRYVNEAQKILNHGGAVIMIQRPGFGPANDEEARSIQELSFQLSCPVVQNTGTPEEMAWWILQLAELYQQRRKEAA